MHAGVLFDDGEERIPCVGSDIRVDVERQENEEGGGGKDKEKDGSEKQEWFHLEKSWWSVVLVHG